MLRTENIAGSHIYPNRKSGEDWGNERLSVFIPTGELPGGNFVCSIGDSEAGTVVVNTLGELARLITALEIAFEKAKAANLPRRISP